MEHDSHYHRQPGVSPVRITVYPKRRLSDLPPALRTIPAERPLRLPNDYSASYIDFFRNGRVAPMATFSHIIADAGAEIDDVVEGRADSIGA
jgi:hypothetical protein